MKITNHGANLSYFAEKYNIDESEIIDFSSNINIFKPNINYEKIMQYIKKNIGKYPDIYYTTLKQSISKIYDISTNSIYLGNGATEVIGDILLLDRFHNIAICDPTFSEYERISNIYKKNIISIDIDKIQEEYNDISNIYIDKKNVKPDIIIIFKDCDLPDILVICNPNNPTGVIYNLHNLLEYCEKNDIFLLVDETFIDFCYNEKYSLKSYVKSYNNLIVISAITKYFAMTGSRLGYSFCSNENINTQLEHVQKPWSINILAESIAYELQNIGEDFSINTKKYFEKENNRLYEKYSDLMDIKIVKSSACYMCITFDYIDVYDLQEYLLINYKILIRILYNYKNIDVNSIRIAIKEREKNDFLFDAIKKYLQLKGSDI